MSLLELIGLPLQFLMDDIENWWRKRKQNSETCKRLRGVKTKPMPKCGPYR